VTATVFNTSGGEVFPTIAGSIGFVHKNKVLCMQEGPTEKLIYYLLIGNQIFLTFLDPKVYPTHHLEIWSKPLHHFLFVFLDA